MSPKCSDHDQAAGEPGNWLTLEDLLALPLPRARRAFERAYFSRLLAQTDDNLSEAARRVGYSRQGLRDLLRRLNLRPK